MLGKLFGINDLMELISKKPAKNYLIWNLLETSSNLNPLIFQLSNVRELETIEYAYL